MNKVIHKLLRIMPVVLLTTAILISCNAFADDTPNTEDPSVTTKIPYIPGTTEYTLDNDMTFRVEVADIPALEITLPSSIVSLDLVPDANTADFNSTDISILVGTTNTTGYTLSMIPSSTNLTRTESINNTTPVISTLDNTVAPNVFSSVVDNTTMNKWGYKLASTNMTNADTTNYHPITTTAIPINESNAAIYNDSTTISFAAKANSEIPGGNYRATLKFMAVTNYVPMTINDLEYMQDFKNLTASEVEEVKDSMPVNAQYQLVDSRDNKTYWLSKLETSCDNPRVSASSDNKCYQIWMTQNLALNLEAVPDQVAPLTNENTDLNTINSWTPMHATIDSSTYGSITICSESEQECRFDTNQGFANGWVDSDSEPYSDNPGYRYVVPTLMNEANTQWWDNGDKIYNDLTSCIEVYSSCDEHNLTGNWYNFAALTANNNETSTVNYELAPNSICPAGWRLPQYGTSVNEFNSVYVAYGINTSNYNPDGLIRLRQAPFYFVRSGYMTSISLGSAGINNNLAYANTYDNERYWYSGFYGTLLYSYDATFKSVGINVRCLVR